MQNKAKMIVSGLFEVIGKSIPAIVITGIIIGGLSLLSKGEQKRDKSFDSLSRTINRMYGSVNQNTTSVSDLMEQCNSSDDQIKCVLLGDYVSSGNNRYEPSDLRVTYYLSSGERYQPYSYMYVHFDKTTGITYDMVLQ